MYLLGGEALLFELSWRFLLGGETSSLSLSLFCLLRDLGGELSSLSESCRRWWGDSSSLLGSFLISRSSLCSCLTANASFQPPVVNCVLILESSTIPTTWGSSSWVVIKARASSSSSSIGALWDFFNDFSDWSPVLPYFFLKTSCSSMIFSLKNNDKRLKIILNCFNLPPFFSYPPTSLTFDFFFFFFFFPSPPSSLDMYFFK
jgi:hypothetical protein